MSSNQNMNNLQQGTGGFISGSVRIVDYSSANTNVLIRGSAAFGASNFQMADLLTAITQDPNFSSLPTSIQKNINNALQQQTSLNVIDFCLIGFSADSKDQNIVEAEAQWFGGSIPQSAGDTPPYPYYLTSPNQDTGTMVFWPVQTFSPNPCQQGGTWGNPPYPDISILPSVQEQDGWNFAGLVSTIYAALSNDTADMPSTNSPYSGGAITSSIIYVHCDSGVNRTGAAVVGYLMKYGSNILTMSGVSPYPLAIAQMAANSASPSNDTNPPGGNDIQVAMAYCNYLNNLDPGAPLSANAVPCVCPSCPTNSSCS